MAKTYNTIGLVSAGDPLTETIWNEQATNVNNYRVPPACKVYANAAKAMVNNTWTSVEFAAEVYDTDEMHNNVTNNSRITIGTAGIYMFTATLQVQNDTTAGNIRQCVIAKNGSPASSGIIVGSSRFVGTSFSNHSVSAVDHATPTDFYEVYFFHDQGSNKNTVTPTLTITSNRITATTSAAEPTPQFSATWIGQVS